MKVGFIGYGSMGSMLLNQFILSGALRQDEIIVFNRTATKLHRMHDSFPEVEIATDVRELAGKAKYIFLCTKALDMLAVLDDLKGSTAPDTHLISIAGSVKASDISKYTNLPVSKLIPTVTSEVLDGVSLLYHEPSVEYEDATFIENLLSKVSKLKLLKEDKFTLAAEVTSCGPGLIAGIFREMLEAAVRHSDFYSREELEEMMIRTLYGTAKLFLEKGLNFDETIARVALKGGITEEGLQVFRNRLPAVFDEMYDHMLQKRIVADQKVEEALSNK